MKMEKIVKGQKIVRTFSGKLIKADDKQRTAEVYVSPAVIDREKEVILPQAWDLANYKEHSPLVDSHTYNSVVHQIGKAKAVEVDDKGLKALFEYWTDKGNFAADWAYFIVKQNQAAYSVGFIPQEWTVNKEEISRALKPLGLGQEDIDKVQRVFTKVELLEVSQVIVPANPLAVQGNEYISFLRKSFGEAKNEMGIDENIKGVVPYKKFPLAPVDTPWSFTAADGNKVLGDPPNWSRYRSVHCWYDETKPEIKASYKLPIAKYVGNEIRVVWRGVAAAMAILLGARGGVDIPDAARKGVYNRLVRYYKDFDKTPPEFREYRNEAETLEACGLDKGMYVLTSEEPLTQEEINFVREHWDVLISGDDNKVLYLRGKQPKLKFVKAGRVISETNRNKLKGAIDQIDNLKSDLDKVRGALEELISLDEGKSANTNTGITEVLKKLSETL